MKPAESIKREILIKGYSIPELAGLYECSSKTLKTWLKHFNKEIGPRMGHCYTPKQVKKIFEEIGIPGEKYIV
jgi:hypothetical protein